MSTATADRATGAAERTAEPDMWDRNTAAKVAGVCWRTLEGLPHSMTGRVKIGRRTLYHVPTLRAYLASLVTKPQAKN